MSLIWTIFMRQRRRQVVHGNFDTADLIVQTLGGKTYMAPRMERRQRAAVGGTEKVAAAGVQHGLDNSRDGEAFAKVCGGRLVAPRSTFRSHLQMRSSP